jgi:hypothetical protein
MSDSFWLSLSVVAVCTLWLAWRGYQRGVLLTAQRFLALLAAYVCCYFLTLPVAELLQVRTGWPRMQAVAVSATGLFFLVSITVGLLVALVARQVENRGTEPARVPAALIGTLLGAVLGILLVWLGGILWDAARLGKAGGKTIAVQQDPVREMAGQIVGGLVETVLSHQGDQADTMLPRAAGELLSNPAQIGQQMMHAVRNPAMKNLFADPHARQAMLNNRTDILQHDPHFQSLMADPEMVALLGTLSKEGEGQQEAEEQAAQTLSQLYQRANRVQQNKQFIRMQQSGEFDRMAKSQSLLEMMRDPAFGKLSQIIMDSTGEAPTFERIAKPEWVAVGDEEDMKEEVAETEAVQGDEFEQLLEAAGQEETVIYRWTDESGRKHYSENRPEGDYKVEAIRQ